jgi:hypothetical protein
MKDRITNAEFEFNKKKRSLMFRRRHSTKAPV